MVVEAEELIFGAPTGTLAAALVKAQAAFPAITRGKEVAGRSYSYKYAPLDVILAAVRGPLAENGLAISQLLDGNDLVTMLLHEGGQTLTGRCPIPVEGTTVQALGSAITYMRRYALVAMLGVAPEDEDDDGDRAVGARVRGASLPDAKPDKMEITTGETLRSLGAIERSGAIAKGSGRHSDLEWRQTPDGYHIGFLLEVGDGKAKPQVSIEGPLAVAVFAAQGNAPLLGLPVTVRGEAFEVTAPQRRKFYRIVAEYIETPEWKLPAPVEAESEPLGLVVDAKEDAEIAALPW